MATCADLVNSVNSVYAALLAASVNLDAIREKLICIEEVLRQAETTREFKALEAEKHQQILIDQTTALCKSLNALTTAVSGQDAPAPANLTISRIAATDLAEFAACSSQLYCPPGLIRDENGNCVEPPE